MLALFRSCERIVTFVQYTHFGSGNRFSHVQAFANLFDYEHEGEHSDVFISAVWPVFLWDLMGF